MGHYTCALKWQATRESSRFGDIANEFAKQRFFKRFGRRMVNDL